MAKKRGSGSGGRRWEGVFHMLAVAGFDDVERSKCPPEGKWFMRNVWYSTIYGTRGVHEFVASNGRELLTVECKFQEASGSVDEKLPYIRESWLRSGPWEGYPFSKHWLVAFDGGYWTRGRGLNAVNWLADNCERHCSSRRSMNVTNGISELVEFLRKWDGCNIEMNGTNPHCQHQKSLF